MKCPGVSDFEKDNCLYSHGWRGAGVRVHDPGRGHMAQGRATGHRGREGTRSKGRRGTRQEKGGALERWKGGRGEPHGTGVGTGHEKEEGTGGLALLPPLKRHHSG